MNSIFQKPLSLDIDLGDDILILEELSANENHDGHGAYLI